MALKKNAHQMFTDREEPRQAFFNTLRKLEENPGSSQIITYYGEGGIGKSWLLKDLKRRIEREEYDAVFEDGFEFRGEYVCVDYNLETSTDLAEILCQLRYILHTQKPDLSFPVFDCAVSKYKDITGKNVASPDSSASSSVLARYENLLDTASMFIPGLGSLQSLYGYVKKGGSILTNVLNKIEDRKIRDEYRDYFDAITSAETADDIRDNLTEFFLFDLNHQEREYCIVFLIDTFEILTYNTGLKNQSWLTEDLAEHAENTLWVFAGRNRIYSDYENEHLLGDLSEADTKYYLREKAEISDEEIIERIYEISHGTPLFLDICVQNYRNEGNPSIEEFRNFNKEQLLKRYIKYLSDGERLVIRLMSSMSHWTDDDYREVFNTVHHDSFSQYMESYARVIRSTMIEMDNEERYFLHRAVRAGIFEDPDYPAEIKSDSMNAILDLYEKRIEAESNLLYYNERMIDLMERKIHFHESYSEEQVFRICSLLNSISDNLLRQGIGPVRADEAYLEQNIEELSITDTERAYFSYALGSFKDELGEYYEAERLLQDAIDHISNIKGDESEEMLYIAFEVAKVYKATGKYREALMLNRKIAESTEKIYGRSHEETINAYNSLAVAYTCLGRQKEAAELYEKVVRLCRETKGEDSPDTVFLLGNLASAYTSIGRYEEALNIKERVYAFYREKYGENHMYTIDAAETLAASYMDLGRYDEAQTMLQDVYERTKDLLGDDHPQTTGSYAMLARMYEDLGRYNEALEIRKEVYERKEARLGRNHPDTLSSESAYAGTLSELRRYEEALQLYLEVYEKRKEILGENHPDTISSEGCLAGVFINLNMFQEAYDLRCVLYEKKKELYGEDNPITLSALHEKGRCLSGLKRDAEAVEIYREAYEKRRKILGDEHPDVLGNLNNLANSLYRIGRKEEALKYHEKIYQTAVKTLGEGHPKTLISLNNIMIIYWYMKKYDQALDLCMKVYEGRKAILGETARDTLVSLEWLSAIYSRLERYADAAEYMHMAIDGYLAIGDEKKVKSLREQLETIPFAV